MRAQTRRRAPGPAAGGAMFTRTALTFLVATMTAAAPGAAAPPAAAVQGGGDARDEGKPARQPATVTSKDGTTIACARSGKGPVVVLVAGALCDRSMNAGLASLLEQRFTVINFDRRGRGGSTDTPPHAVEREVEDIEALIDAAGGTAFLYGISSGAVLALEAASRLPTKVTRLVLYEPPFIVDDSRPPLPAEFARKLTELLAADRRGDAVAYFMTDAVGVPSEAVAGMRRAPMWAGLEKVAHTLPYDLAVMGDTQAGKPLPRQRWAGS